LFADIAEEFLEFITGSELVIHNAEFDVGFLEYELKLMKHAKGAITDHATVLDTLSLARKLHPGQRNSLDALCKRYEVDASRRDVHGALIDSELLARVYLAMTGGQSTLLLDEEKADATAAGDVDVSRQRPDGLKLAVIKASDEELAAHESILDKMNGGGCLYRGLNSGEKDAGH
jgi:DNA polymerase-3 subunit epsilon